MRVLVACEESQAVCQAFRERGHEAYSCDIIPCIQNSIPGGTWRDWSLDLQLSCHKKKSGVTYPSVYGRMEWDVPSPTITTQFYGYGNGRFGHPEQDRALSIREGAMLQSFPAQYAFVPPNEKVNKRVLGIHIGNAVPVALGRAIGISIQNHIEEVEKKWRSVRK